MAFKLNWVGCVWRTASMGYLKRGRELGYLLGDGGGVKQLISSSSSSSSSYSSPSSWSLLSRGITINSSSPCVCNHPLLSSTAPCLLIPSPRKDDEVIAKEVGNDTDTGTGTGSGEDDFLFPGGYCFYSLADRKVVSLNNVIPDHAICIGASHGWLAYLDTRDPTTLFLTNPFDIVSPVPPTIRLPPMKTLPRTIHGVFEESWSYLINKIVMSSAPSPSSDDCTVMVSGALDGRDLAFCKIGDSSWTDLKYSHGARFATELAYSSKDQLFYCRPLFSYSKLAAWDLRGNPCSPRRIDIDTPFAYGVPDYPDSEMKQRQRDGLYERDYLVMDSHSGDVLLVTKYSEKFSFGTLRIDVYRLNAAKRGWDYVTDLGDGVLFVGLNQAFMLSARDFPPGVLIPNSIYFTFEFRDDEPIDDTDKDRDGDMGIYNMRDFTITPLFPSHLHPFNKIHHPPPIWFTPNPLNI